MPCSSTINCKVLCSSTKYGVAILHFDIMHLEYNRRIVDEFFFMNAQTIRRYVL